MARGDHYEVSRYGYRHHGIDIGDGTVVHFTGEPMRKLQAMVQRTDWKEFTRGDPCRVVEYSGWTWTPDHVCLRALRMCGMTGYNLVRNNCEHFAQFCKSGQFRSHQIEQSVSNVWKYSKFAVHNPALILAGPAYETARRLTAATAHLIKQFVDAEPPSIAPVPDAVGLCSYFHYVDLYGDSVSGQNFAVTPYGGWFRLSDDSPLSEPESSATIFGKLYVDDSLMIYLDSAAGFYRFAANDQQVCFAGALYDHNGTKYRLDKENNLDMFVSRKWERVQVLPQGSVLEAYIFEDINGIVRLQTKSGWFTGQNGTWIEEPPFRAMLKFI